MICASHSLNHLLTHSITHRYYYYYYFTHYARRDAETRSYAPSNSAKDATNWCVGALARSWLMYRPTTSGGRLRCCATQMRLASVSGSVLDLPSGNKSTTACCKEEALSLFLPPSLPTSICWKGTSENSSLASPLSFLLGVLLVTPIIREPKAYLPPPSLSSPAHLTPHAPSLSLRSSSSASSNDECYAWSC